MSGVQIPNDWDGDDLTCFTVFWPDTPQWIGLLVGLLSYITRGRFYDANSGNIRSAQEVGRTIFEANIPLVTCDGSGEVSVPDTDIIHAVMGGCFSEIDAMTLCGYNPKAFRIDDGKLYVRDFCGEWVEIGSLSPSGNLPPESDQPDPLPEGMLATPACAMASKLVGALETIISVAFDSVNGADPLYGWIDFQDDVGSAVPGIDLAFSDTFNMFYNVWALNVAGYGSETQNPLVGQALRCAYAAVLTPSNAGISSDEYTTLRNITNGIAREWLGEHYGFETTMGNVWENAIKAIGAKDAAKLTYNVQPTEDMDCSCPEEPEPPIEATTNGWYLLGPYNVDIAHYAYNSFGTLKQQLPHDTYGVALRATWSGQMNPQVTSSSNHAGIGVYDRSAHGNTSGFLTVEPQDEWHVYGVTQAVADEIFGAGNYRRYTGADNNMGDSADASQITIVAGNVLAATLVMNDSHAGAELHGRYWYICNVNSSSHL